jgi:membrane protein implicated in regulation of membrane protease activity
MVDPKLLVRQNPIPTVLSAMFLLAVFGTVGFAVTGGSFRWQIRLVALCVVLAVFAGGFWVSVIGERMDERKRRQRRR